MSEAVYLTFDDGPDELYTPQVLDALDVVGAKATFFVLGSLAQQCPELVREVQARGHEVGNHSFHHYHPRFTLPGKARRDVIEGTDAITDILGAAPRLFRPPHGYPKRASLAQAEALGQATVLWDISAIDWGPRGQADGIRRRLATVGAGDIVLMHDGSRGINHRRRHSRSCRTSWHGSRVRGLLPVRFPDTFENQRRLRYGRCATTQSLG